MSRARARVHGRVQGVFYRATTAREAAALGVTGWVRNQPDGSVLLEAQGDRAAVDALLDWCRHGPPGAFVSRIDTEWLADVAGETGFRVRH